MIRKAAIVACITVFASGCELAIPWLVAETTRADPPPGSTVVPLRVEVLDAQGEMGTTVLDASTFDEVVAENRFGTLFIDLRSRVDPALSVTIELCNAEQVGDDPYGFEGSPEGFGAPDGGLPPEIAQELGRCIRPESSITGCSDGGCDFPRLASIRMIQSLEGQELECDADWADGSTVRLRLLQNRR